MSRSRKKIASSTWVGCKSQKWGKQMSNRRFRHRERQCLGKSFFDELPQSPEELTDGWELGGDGKMVIFAQSSERYEKYLQLKRK